MSTVDQKLVEEHEWGWQHPSPVPESTISSATAWRDLSLACTSHVFLARAWRAMLREILSSLHLLANVVGGAK
jgi:hypothetical protein